MLSSIYFMRDKVADFPISGHKLHWQVSVLCMFGTHREQKKCTKRQVYEFWNKNPMYISYITDS